MKTENSSYRGFSGRSLRPPTSYERNARADTRQAHISRAKPSQANTTQDKVRQDKGKACITCAWRGTALKHPAGRTRSRRTGPCNPPPAIATGPERTRTRTKGTTCCTGASPSLVSISPRGSPAPQEGFTGDTDHDLDHLDKEGFTGRTRSRSTVDHLL